MQCKFCLIIFSFLLPNHKQIKILLSNLETTQSTKEKKDVPVASSSFISKVKRELQLNLYDCMLCSSPGDN